MLITGACIISLLNYIWHWPKLKYVSICFLSMVLLSWMFECEFKGYKVKKSKVAKNLLTFVVVESHIWAEMFKVQAVG